MIMVTLLCGQDFAVAYFDLRLSCPDSFGDLGGLGGHPAQTSHSHPIASSSVPHVQGLQPLFVLLILGALELDCHSLQVVAIS